MVSCKGRLGHALVCMRSAEYHAYLATGPSWALRWGILVSIRAVLELGVLAAPGLRFGPSSHGCRQVLFWGLLDAVGL
jgi:hypothetical protein